MMDARGGDVLSVITGSLSTSGTTEVSVLLTLHVK